MYQRRMFPSSQRTGGFRPAALFICLSLIVMLVVPASGIAPAAANAAPTLEAIADITVAVGGGNITVPLAGISAGAGDVGQVVSITASSNNTALIPDPAVSYTNPDATGSLTLAPVASATGVATITVTVKDDGGVLDGGVDTFTRTFQVTINMPPVISPFTKTGVRGQPLVFSALDFTNAYADLEGSPLAMVKIVALPGVGTLALNGIPVAAGAEIPASQLGQLSYIPQPGWYGSATFYWNGSDGLDYGAPPALVTLTYPYSALNVYLPLAMRPGTPWNTVVAENFEGGFPAGWQLDSAWYYGGTYYNVTSQVAWGKRTCHAFSGSYGGWAVGGGSIGSTKPCSAGYPDDTLTFMTYGPINLSQVKDGLLSMKFWLDSEYSYDHLGMGVSIDNNMFYGDFFSGNSNGWQVDTLDLKNVPTLGNVTGRSQVWIGMWFDTDYANLNYEEGAFIDDILLATCPSVGGCTTAPTFTQAHAQAVSGEFEIKQAEQVRIKR